MAANPLRIAQRRAEQDNYFLERLFGRYIGGKKHPRGAILSAYRRARRELARAVSDPAAAEEILTSLRFELAGATGDALVQSTARGQESAELQADAYNRDDQNSIGTKISIIDIAAYSSAILTAFDAQRSILSTLLRTGADKSLIVGDKSRLGALKPGPVMTEAARWLATAQQDSFEKTLDAPGFDKQAIPVFDQFTTDCCLAVAGQIQPLDGLFDLTGGTPRFADHLPWSPFHWNCRTSIALYKPSYDDGLTDALVDDARKERDSR